ncbi:uncharacterized protein LOC134828771 [Culicoides brevitarsis]|uniref:uncharacterized protein LOC134828771 n=1 Tax=Culicoides brevitarsis TaxID=469753 RepID=UPI00307C6DB3
MIQQEWDKDIVTLSLNESVIKNYAQNSSSLQCCYQNITRVNGSDNNINLSTCKSFHNKIQLPEKSEFVLVRCKVNGNVVYKNGYALVRKKSDVVKRFKKPKFSNNSTQKRPLSVLLIGIDSISRLNLKRSMPKTANYLHSNGWMELEGYNKIADNTFPNLMAILTGFNSTMSYKVCSPTKMGKLDACPMVWYTFKENGYATAYAEDEMSINTFNYHKTGFVSPPVDHYFRPFGLAAESYLQKKKEDHLDVCLGYQTYADHIYQYAVDFATQYKGNPYFGLFWTSSFSHNDFSSPTAMDAQMLSYVVKLNETGILNDALVVFFSDHGVRFGDVRKLLIGWYEERLPFIFFSFPAWFKEKYFDYVRNFEINKNRLTTPFDLHVTLKNVLSLSKSFTENLSSSSCASCQSLFEEIPERSCEDASIEEHWCTCTPYEKIDKNSTEIKKAVDFVINVMNQKLKTYKAKTKATTKYSNKCAELRLKHILNAYMGKSLFGDITYYLVSFVAKPSRGEFEATVKYNEDIGYHLSGSISRLNWYGKQSDCVNDANMKNYCFCYK